MNILPVILSGGIGSCLWPLSREHFPKQCLPLTNEQFSLLQQTINRTSSLDVDSPIIVCNESHRFLIAEQLQDIGVVQASILLESEGRNTAPAIALAVVHVPENPGKIPLH